MRLSLVGSTGWHEIEERSDSFVALAAPDHLVTPGKLDVLRIADIFLNKFFDFSVDVVEELPDGFLGLTDFHDRRIAFPELVYTACEHGDPKARFTVAHEIAHVALHEEAGAQRNQSWHSRGLLYAGAESIPPREDPEWQADKFAAAILAPRNAFWAAVQETGDSGATETLCALSSTFGISVGAAQARWKDLVQHGFGPDPAAQDSSAELTADFPVSRGADGVQREPKKNIHLVGDLPNFAFDVALSFAHEDRAPALELARLLNADGRRVFYDYSDASHLGKDFANKLSRVFDKESQFCIVFLSKNYERSAKCQFELMNALRRATRTEGRNLLALRLDDTMVEGTSNAAGYVDLRHTSIEEAYILFKSRWTERDVSAAAPPSQPNHSDLESWSGSLIKVIRNKLNWTQAELARKANVSDRVIRAVEKRGKVRNTTLRRIVEALNTGLREGPVQLEFAFVDFRVDELCKLNKDHGCSLPGPVENRDQEEVFERLARRELPHQATMSLRGLRAC